ncbi:MAG: caspase family protein, partial [Candidatus Sulfopaludibacter sp.]|nr:caspase family protein [Candidatus Sulfopaludibacter sp.]
MFRTWSLLSIFFLCVSSPAQTRRALLVGIDQYAPADPSPAPWKPTPLRPVPLNGVFKQVVWPKLNGAVNDMKSMHRMLLTRGFKEADIIELANGQATADAILTTIKSHLFDKARPGDSSLFYFAGHGARIVNKHANLPGGADVTMVTYDAPKGVPALRDKELARLYRQVPPGVALTVIQDNCYSSGGARGIAPPLVTRDAPEDTRTVDDPPEPNLKPVDQQENAVLILAASQFDQKAEELDVTDQPDLTGDAGLPHGRFTFALLEAMRDSLP